MRILLVNDDGIEGVGLIAMVKELYGCLLYTSRCV